MPIFAALWKMQRGLYIRFVQPRRAGFIPGASRAGSAKPGREAGAGSHLALLRVVTAFNLLRTAICLFTYVQTRTSLGDMAPSTGGWFLPVLLQKQPVLGRSVGAMLDTPFPQTPSPSHSSAPAPLLIPAPRAAGSASLLGNHVPWARAYQISASHNI